MTEQTLKSGAMKESGDLVMLSAIIGMILLMVLPLPPVLLDLFFVVSIAISVLILLLGFYALKPLDFSVFPSLLLFATLFRLTLNIASTRLILLHGAEGDSAAGRVIQAFGYFVTGGNYVVGFVVFIILVIINFVVITKGAGRIAEVAARFTLDSMPGKQLAIDADMNAGIINEKEAKERRQKLESEADFYGAMDGASKFVRGDAIAGIIITAVNVVGGLIVGMVQQGLDLTNALKIYTVLTVGDGLVTQLPALIISVAAGMIVTKVSRTNKLSDEINSQTTKHWRPMGLSALVLLILGLVPGLPFFPFLLFAGILGYGALQIKNKADLPKPPLETEAQANIAANNAPAVSEKSDSIPPLDLLELEVGYDLISLVDQRSGGEFPNRILGIRRQFANEMGVLLPPVHIRDNLKLHPTEYRIYLKGAVVGTGEILPHHALALDPGTTTRKLDGIPTKDPTFGLDALWIPDEKKEAAIVAGYTVVDLPSVMATHLIEIVSHNLSELFGRQDLSAILEQMKQTHPRVVSDLIPELLPFGIVLKVLQNLLRERVSIRDMLTILETLAEHASHTKDAEELTEYARVALGRNIAQQHLAPDKKLYVITLARNLEDKIIRSVSTKGGSTHMAFDPTTAKAIVEQIGMETKKHLTNSQPPVVLTSQQVRPHLYRLIEKFIPNLAVLAHAEVAGHVSVKPVGMVGEAA